MRYYKPHISLSSFDNERGEWLYRCSDNLITTYAETVSEAYSRWLTAHQLKVKQDKYYATLNIDCRGD